MHVIYVAKHGSGGNDDEGAVLHALLQLGCTVETFAEDQGQFARDKRADLLLFHKWEDTDSIAASLCRRKALWYFDRVDDPDPSLYERNARRVQWLQRTLPHATHAFLTDGDYAVRCGARHLLQGYDSRLALYPAPYTAVPPYLMLASRKGGARRTDFCAWAEQQFGVKLHTVERRLHGMAQRTQVRNALANIAPDYPVSDRYWSNRAYVICGHGGLLLHPYSEGLRKQYPELPMYKSRAELVRMLKCDHANAARDCELRTLMYYTYTHRVKELLECTLS